MRSGLAGLLAPMAMLGFLIAPTSPISGHGSVPCMHDGHACAPVRAVPRGESVADDTIVVDSAGIRILVSERPRWSDPPRLDPRRLLEVGGRNIDFFRVTSGFIRRDGGFVVANAGSNEILVFDEDGEPTARLGGSGSAPGEFSRLGAIYPDLDRSVGALDIGARRYTRLGRTGEVLEAIRLSEVLTGPITQVFPFDAGRYVVTVGGWAGGGRPPESGSIRRPDQRVVLLGSREGRLDTLRSVPGIESFFVSSSGGVAIGRPPFGKETLFAVDSGRILYNRGLSHDIRRLDASGSLRAIFRIVADDLSLDEEDWEERLAELIGEGADEEARRSARAVYGQLAPPDTRPPYSQLTLDDWGYLWAAGFHFRGEPIPRWHVFDRTGAWVATVPGAGELTRVLDIAECTILGVRRGPFDVERVVAVPIEFPRESGRSSACDAAAVGEGD